jgi:tetratricopeptide (TPR) repeat protein
MIRQYYFLIIPIFICLNVNIYGQKKSVIERKSDSIYNVLLKRIDFRLKYSYSSIKDSLINSDHGYALALVGKSDEAIEYVEKELKVNPVNINAINTLGINLFNIKKPELSIKFFELSLRLIPDDHTAKYNLAYANEQSNRFDKALEGYTYLINKYPKSSNNYYYRARVYYNMNNDLNAIPDFKMAITLGGFKKETKVDSATIFFRIATCYEHQKDYTKAIEYYSYAFNNNENLVKAIERRSNIYYEINDFDNALVDFNRVIEFKSTGANSQYYKMRAYIYFVKQKFEDSLKDLNYYIQLKPNDFEAYNSRGTIYIMMNLKEKACKDFSKAIDLGYNSKDKVKNYCNK